MTEHPSGLRERKKQQQRQRLVRSAEALFARDGYDHVSMTDVARAAEVADQTIYNYFPAKHHLVLDRADEIRERYGRLVRARQPGTSPASVFRALVREDIERYQTEDPQRARGQLPALCYQSDILRRFALQMREAQIETVTDAALASGATAPRLVLQAHVASLVWLVQAVTDRIGANVLAGDRSPGSARALRAEADVVLDELDRHFALIDGAKPASSS